MEKVVPKKPGIEDMPWVCLEKICENLSAKDIFHLMQTSKSMYQKVDHEQTTIWRTVCKRHPIANADWIERSPDPAGWIAKHWVQHIEKWVLHSRGYCPMRSASVTDSWFTKFKSSIIDSRSNLKNGKFLTHHLTEKGLVAKPDDTQWIRHDITLDKINFAVDGKAVVFWSETEDGLKFTQYNITGGAPRIETTTIAPGLNAPRRILLDWPNAVIIQSHPNESVLIVARLDHFQILGRLELPEGFDFGVEFLTLADHRISPFDRDEVPANFSPDGTVLIDGSTMGIVTRAKETSKWLIIRTSYPDCRNTETFPLNWSNAVSFGLRKAVLVGRDITALFYKTSIVYYELTVLSSTIVFLGETGIEDQLNFKGVVQDFLIGSKNQVFTIDSTGGVTSCMKTESSSRHKKVVSPPVMDLMSLTTQQPSQRSWAANANTFVAVMEIPFRSKSPVFVYHLKGNPLKLKEEAVTLPEDMYDLHPAFVSNDGTMVFVQSYRCCMILDLSFSSEAFCSSFNNIKDVIRAQQNVIVSNDFENVVSVHRF